MSAVTLLKRIPMNHTTKALLLAALAPAMFVPAMGWSQTTGTAAPVPPARPVVTPQMVTPAPSANTSETTLPRYTSRAVLLGEQVAWFTDNRKVAPADVISSASDILRLELRDETVPGEAAAATLARAEKALESKPSVVILVTGATDETSRTAETAFRDTVTEIVRKAGSVSPAVFIVPSSTGLSASRIAALREAAINTGAQFVETGTQFEGTPYFDALEEIHRIRTGAPEPASVPVAGATPKPAPAPRASAPADRATTVSGELAIQRAPAIVFEEPDLPEDEGESSGPRTVQSGAAPTPITGQYVPPPALKRVDPSSQSLVPKRTKNKRPSVEN